MTLMMNPHQHIPLLFTILVTQIQTLHEGPTLLHTTNTTPEHLPSALITLLVGTEAHSPLFHPIDLSLVLPCILLIATEDLSTLPATGHLLMFHRDGRLNRQSVAILLSLPVIRLNEGRRMMIAPEELRRFVVPHIVAITILGLLPLDLVKSSRPSVGGATWTMNRLLWPVTVALGITTFQL
jgi:hypothetical protein